MTSIHLSRIVLLAACLCASPASRAQDAKAEAKAHKAELAEIKALEKQAGKGDAKAQLALAVRYTEGNGVPRDLLEAIGWFRKAAAQGDAKAQTSLGIFYAFGQGVREDAA